MTKRPYVQTVRREQKEQTRQRIVDAMVALHEELGPKNTTIAAIAERAGVQRLTVYRHFEDEAAMLQACSGHWLSQHPPPQTRDWEAIENPNERARATLRAVYRYYARTEGMLSKVYRDASEMESLRPIMEGVDAHFTHLGEEMAEALSTGRVRKTLRAAACHLLRFSTWQSLRNEQLDERGMVQVGLDWLEALSD